MRQLCGCKRHQYEDVRRDSVVPGVEVVGDPRCNSSEHIVHGVFKAAALRGHRDLKTAAVGCVSELQHPRVQLGVYNRPRRLRRRPLRAVTDGVQQVLENVDGQQHPTATLRVERLLYGRTKVAIDGFFRCGGGDSR